MFCPSDTFAAAPVALIVKAVAADKLVLGTVLPALAPVLMSPEAVIEMAPFELVNVLPLSIRTAPEAPVVATSERVMLPLLEVRLELMMLRLPDDLAPLVLIVIPETAETTLD